MNETAAPGAGREPSRRGLLRAALAGGGALAAGIPLAACGRGRPGGVARASAAGPAFSVGWLFGGECIPGSESANYDDSAFIAVTLPHSVPPLSYADWDPAAWEKVWIYRRHFNAAPFRDQRIFADFGGVMVDALAVVVNTV